LHVLDIGGMGVSGSAPAAVSVYDEALRFAAIRVIRDGRVDEEWRRYLVQNVRTPGPVLNDIRSMIAANNVAEWKLQDVIERFGLERHREYNEYNKLLTEQLLRRRIEAMPDGRYEAVEYVEFDAKGTDDLVEIRCTLEVAGSDLRFAFTGDPQLAAPVNGTEGQVYGGVMTHLLTMLGYGDLPFNAGIWRPLSIDLGTPGTVVNPLAPAPVSMGHGEAGFRCGKAARHVLNQAASLSEDPSVRSRVGGIGSDAIGAACLFGADAAGAPTVLIYIDPQTGVGGGAQTVADGQDMHGACTMAGSGMPDVEVHESTDPVLFLWRRVAANSGGPGQLRGGQALDQAYLILGESSFTGFTTLTCAEFPPPGFGGGLPPGAGVQYPVRATRYLADDGPRGRSLDEAGLGGTKEVIGTKVGYFVIGPGDVLRSIGGGGAGLGDPLLRDPQWVAADVRDGYITSAHADAAYGVVLRVDGGVDPGATDARRRQLRVARIGGAPARRARAPHTIGVSLTVQNTDGKRKWSCGYCDAELSPLREDWREAVVRDSRPIADMFAQLGMQVREREVPPAIATVNFYCPECAGALATDVITDRHKARSPVLAPPAVTGVS
jgi:N-methylhydantoinase B